MLVFIKEIRVKDTGCWFKKKEVYYEIRGKVIDRIDLKKKKNNERDPRQRHWSYVGFY